LMQQARGAPPRIAIPQDDTWLIDAAKFSFSLILVMTLYATTVFVERGCGISQTSTQARMIRIRPQGPQEIAMPR
jgi:hypothetical protein